MMVLVVNGKEFELSYHNPDTILLTVSILLSFAQARYIIHKPCYVCYISI